jgi:short subunit fatty acids transporter
MSYETESAATEDEHEKRFTPFFGKFFPESLTLAILLALITVVLTSPFIDVTTQLRQLSLGWAELLAVNMAIILWWLLPVTIVESPRFGRVLDSIASFVPASSQSSVIYSIGFISLLFGWINWAFGLIGGILIGQRVCKKAEENDTVVHYPLVLTASLLALIIANQGITSPGGLLMTAEETNFIAEEVGTLSISSFVLEPINLISSILLIVTLPAVLVLLAPTEENVKSIESYEELPSSSISDTLNHYTPPEIDASVVADKIENSQAISVIAFFLGGFSILSYFIFESGNVTILWYLFTLMILGLVFQKYPMAFVEKTNSAAKWANHVAIPFIFYAGIFALLRESGLRETVGSVIASVGGEISLSFIIAFVVGLFVPDPGWLWVIEGPVLVSAGADTTHALIAVMYGAGLSNLWLGFLFASLLSINGFSWREYTKYASAITIYVALIVLGVIAIL